LQIMPGLFSRGGGFGQDTDSTPADQRLVGQVRRHMTRQGQGQAGASESVRIVALNGVVTLVGFVTSIEEKQALEAAVQSTPGVLQVIDQLQVSANAGVVTRENGNSATVGGSAGFGQGTNSASAAGRPSNIIIGTNSVPVPPR